jgi:LuxR family transcriptional regulator, maltose regulon positive regulatory protein
VWYTIAPSGRDATDALALDGVFELGRTMGRALVAAREQGDLVPAGALEWPSVEITRALLPPLYAAELALYSVTAGGAPPPVLLIEPRATVLRALERVSAHRPELRAAVARARAAMPRVRPFNLTIHLSGRLTIERDGTIVDPDELRRERVRALLTLLALHRRVSRRRAAAILWPDMDDATAARNLRVTLAHLQRALEPERAREEAPYFLRSERGELTLVDDVRTDFDLFNRAIGDALDAESRRASLDALAAYELAISLYHGPVGGTAEWDWLEDTRERTRRRFVAAALRAAELQLARGEPERALAHATAARSADETVERAYLLSGEASLATGDRDGARQWVERAHALARDLGVTPSADLIAITQRVSRG